MKTRREEIAEDLTRGMSGRDKQRLKSYLCGKGEINGAEFIKFSEKLEEFERRMKQLNAFESFLSDNVRSRRDLPGCRA